METVDEETGMGNRRQGNEGRHSEATGERDSDRGTYQVVRLRSETLTVSVV